MRCAVFHISSYAWSHACAELCERWVESIASCISHQVDFIQGDGNLFAQRNFKKDAHSDFRSCVLIDFLEKFLGQVNLHRSAMNHISYNVIFSSQAAEYIKAQENDPPADCDSMLCISLCYGKHTIVTEDRSKQQSASADGYAGSSFDNEIMLSDVEQPKHLMVYDLGLGDADQAFHSPLVAIANMRAIKNYRIRSQAAETRRRSRWQERNVEDMQARQERGEIRQERQDTVPPLRRDNF